MIKKVALDATLATTGTFVAMLAGLLIMPHLIGVMGNANYGLWTLVAGLATYLGVLDFGVTAAVYRLTARSGGGSRHTEINELMSTAVALLTLLALIFCILTWLAAPLFFEIFDVPRSQMSDVREALWVVGLTVAANVPLEAYAGLLWAHERFDLLNLIDIFAAILRTVLTLVYVGPDRPLLHVALINALAKGLASIAKVKTCYSLVPKLVVSPANVSRRRARELFSFGMWMNLLVITKSLLPQIIAAFIAKLVSASALTTFAVARQLVFYTNDFTNAATQVVAPRAAKLNAGGDLALQQDLLVNGGRCSHALAMFFFGGFLSLGSYFIEIWQRGSQNAAYVLLVILLAGEVLPISQWVTYSQIVGALRQRVLAYFSLLEGLLASLACVILLPHYGLIGASLGIAAVASLTRGVLRWWYGCRLLKIGMALYARRVYLGVTIRALVPIVLTVLVADWARPSSWVGILSLGATYAVVFAILVGVPLLGAARLRAAVVSFAHQWK